LHADRQEKIAREMPAMLSTWRHSGFHVFCGNRIQPKEKEAVEALARYIIRATFSQERMQYLADEGAVVYLAKDGKDRKVFDAPEWLAAMCSHVPNRGEQMVRYYGWYSNVARGKIQNLGEDGAIPPIIESDSPPAAFRKRWARLIQKTDEVDPLICPKCRGTIRIISFIEDREVIKTILSYLGLWLIRSRPPTKAHAQQYRYAINDFYR
jgi:hypothetical protein